MSFLPSQRVPSQHNTDCLHVLDLCQLHQQLQGQVHLQVDGQASLQVLQLVHHLVLDLVSHQVSDLVQLWGEVNLQ